MADKKQTEAEKIDAIAQEAIRAQEKASGNTMSREDRAAVRESVVEVFKEQKEKAEKIGTGVAATFYGVDGAAISKSVADNGLKNATTQAAKAPVDIAKAFAQSSFKSGAAATVIRGAPLLNVGIAAYEVVNAETPKEKAEAGGGFLGATAAAAATGCAIGTIAPGIGNVAGILIGGAAGATGYLVGKYAGGWLADKFSSPAATPQPPTPALQTIGAEKPKLISRLDTTPAVTSR